jgi:hypothetical protein
VHVRRGRPAAYVNPGTGDVHVDGCPLLCNLNAAVLRADAASFTVLDEAGKC